MKKIALYGGSFNPPTIAHRDIGLTLLEQLPVDEVWYLVSPQNPFKSPEGMAPFADRLFMTELNLAEYPRLIAKDIEARYVAERGAASINTADTLRLLTRDFPDHRFIWVMGADVLRDFHMWDGADYIANHFPIAVIPRKNYTALALQSVTAQKTPRRIPGETSDAPMPPGLYLLNVEESGIAASQAVSELAGGQMPESLRPSVARYALKSRFYTPGRS